MKKVIFNIGGEQIVKTGDKKSTLSRCTTGVLNEGKNHQIVEMSNDFQMLMGKYGVPQYMGMYVC